MVGGFCYAATLGTFVSFPPLGRLLADFRLQVKRAHQDFVRSFVKGHKMAEKKKKKTTKEHADVEIIEREDSVKRREPKTKKLPVTLNSGQEIEIEILANQDDWSFGAVQAMEQENYATLVGSILTKASRWQLNNVATVADFRIVSDAISGYLSEMRADIEG